MLSRSYQWLRSWRTRSVRAARRKGARRANQLGTRVRRITLEPLEDRSLLSTIHWTNRGSASNDSDHFNAMFGANANAARLVADAAFAAWSKVITNLNLTDGSNELDIRLTETTGEPASGGNGGVDTILNGKPKTGEINIVGNGYYLDPTPNDSSEFEGIITNAFVGTAPATINGQPNPVASMGDYFTVVVLETAHCLGFSKNPTLDIWTSGMLTQTGITIPAGQEESSVGLPGYPLGDNTYWHFHGPHADALFNGSSQAAVDADIANAYNAVHLAAAKRNLGKAENTVTVDNVTITTSQESNEAVFYKGVRYLPSRLVANILGDAYGYTITDPTTFGTFYDHLDASGKLLIRGGANSDDTISITRDQNAPDFINVSVAIGRPVPGTQMNGTIHTRFYVPNNVTSIEIDAGNGSNTINLDGRALATVPVLVHDDFGIGNNAIYVDDSASNDANDTYTIQDNRVIRSGWNGGLAYLTPYGSLTLLTEGGTSTVNVESTGSGMPVTIQGKTTCTVHVGSGGFGSTTQNIRGGVIIDNPPSYSSITVDDSGDGVVHNATSGNAIVLGTNPAPTHSLSTDWGYIKGIAPADIIYKYHDTASLMVRTGTAVSNEIGVWENGVTTNIASYGPAATVNVGDGDVGVQSILRTLTITNPNYHSAIIVDDSHNTGVYASAHMGTIPSPWQPGWGYITGLGLAADIIYKYVDTSSVTIHTSAGEGDIFGVWENLATTNVICHGLATVNVGDGYVGLQDIDGILTINSPLTDAVVLDLNDQIDPTGRTATLSSGSVSDLGPADIIYGQSALSNLNINGGTGGNTFNILSTPSAVFVPRVGLAYTLTTVNCSSADTVNVGDANGVQDILGTLTVNSAFADSVNLNLNDQMDTTGRVASLASGSVNDLAPADINYGQNALSNLNINGGTGGNTFNIQSTPSAVFVPRVGLAYTLTTLNCSGADTVNVGDANGVQDIRGTLTVNSGLAHSVNLHLNDQSDAVDRTVTITNNSVPDLAPADINYGQSALGSLSIDGGNGVNVFNILSIAVNTPVTVNTGVGVNTINVTHTDINGVKTQESDVQVNGGGTQTSVAIFDQANPQTPVIVGPSGITIGDPVTIGFSNIQSVSLYGAISGDYSIESTPQGTPIIIYLGAGPNSFHVASEALANLTLSGGGVAPVIFDNSADTLGATYIITSSTVQVNGSTPINYSGASSLTVIAGSGNDTMVVQSTAAGMPTFVDGGRGNDVFVAGNNGSLAGIEGAVQFRGSDVFAGDDLLVEGGSDPTPKTNVVLEDGSITGLAPAPIS
jgi:hypothetical protein